MQCLKNNNMPIYSAMLDPPRIILCSRKNYILPIMAFFFFQMRELRTLPIHRGCYHTNWLTFGGKKIHLKMEKLFVRRTDNNKYVRLRFVAPTHLHTHKHTLTQNSVTSLPARPVHHQQFLILIQLIIIIIIAKACRRRRRGNQNRFKFMHAMNE